MQTLNDKDFLKYVRTLRYGSISQDDFDYIERRLKDMGYVIEYGCCGTNRIIKYANNQK